MQSWIRPVAKAAVLLSVGIWIGGVLFSSSQKRSVLAVAQCADCLSSSQLLGLAASVGIRFAPGLLPDIIIESDKAVGIKSPIPVNAFHAVVFPKKDIKDVADITLDDQSYVMACLAMLAQIARTHHLKNYQIVSNSRGLQDINYLHFHLISPETGLATR